jgi:hypothetical protein
MPSRNFTVPVSDCSPEAIDRTARAEDPGTCRFRCKYPQGRISLVNSRRLVSPARCGIS